MKSRRKHSPRPGPGTPTPRSRTATRPRWGWAARPSPPGQACPPGPACCWPPPRPRRCRPRLVCGLRGLLLRLLLPTAAAAAAGGGRRRRRQQRPPVLPGVAVAGGSPTPAEQGRAPGPRAGGPAGAGEASAAAWSWLVGCVWVPVVVLGIVDMQCKGSTTTTTDGYPPPSATASSSLSIIHRTPSTHKDRMHTACQPTASTTSP